VGSDKLEVRHIGDGSKFITCPVCFGEGCEHCKKTGLVPLGLKREEAFTAEGNEAIRAWGHYKNHFLPSAGAISDQSATCIDAFEFLNGFEAAEQMKEIKANKKRAEEMASRIPGGKKR
jgi:hypothetical protein